MAGFVRRVIRRTGCQPTQDLLSKHRLIANLVTQYQANILEPKRFSRKCRSFVEIFSGLETRKAFSTFQEMMFLLLAYFAIVGCFQLAEDSQHLTADNQTEMANWEVH